MTKCRSSILLAVVLGLLFFAMRPAQAQTYTLLYSFTGGTDGAYPNSRLYRDATGNLFGAAYNGGNLSDCGGIGCGTVFKLDPAGTLTVLHAFTGKDGWSPNGSMAADGSRNLYSTTDEGGDLNCPNGGFGCGTVFKVNKETGRRAVLYRFAGGADGIYANPGLIRDVDGALYGMTNGGGKGKCNAPLGEGCGTVFKLDPAGKHTILYKFTGGSDGGAPDAGLVRDSLGNLYGKTVIGGGVGCGGDGCGTVFKLSAAGKFKVLYRFTGYKDGGDGYDSYGSLIRDSSGNLYGTVPFGGDMNCKQGNWTRGCGVVFKVDNTGKETVLYAFTDGVDGAFPFFGLTRDRAGNLFGTTSAGGDFSGCGSVGCGTVFKLDQNGKLTTLYSFTGGSDGSFANDMVLDASGNLYGVTGGGTGNSGTIFRIAQ